MASPDQLSVLASIKDLNVADAMSQKSSGTMENGFDHGTRALEASKQDVGSSIGSSVGLPIRTAGLVGGGAGGSTSPPSVTSLNEWLLLLDLEKSLVDFDVTERVTEDLAPELLPMLKGQGLTESCVPITNTVLAELQRRGVARDQLLCTLKVRENPPMPVTVHGI
jgi:hypothetical protein